MSGTKEGALKARQTQIEKYGGQQGYEEEMKRRQSKGGKAPRSTPPTFKKDPEIAKKAGRKGHLSRGYSVK